MPTNHDQAQPLDLQRLAAALAAAPIGHNVHHHFTVPSTMPIAHALAARADVRAGTLVVAEEQTAGRGRRARVWHAPRATSLLVSVILKPPLLPSDPAVLPQLPMLAAIAVVDAVADTVAQTSAASCRARPALALKWPNDVLIRLADGTLGKLAGILVESTFHQNALGHSILGIGINANQRDDELPPAMPGAPPPASLHMALGHPVDRTTLLIELCRALAALVEEPIPSPAIFARWRDLLVTRGSRVVVYPAGLESGEAISGMALDVEPDGALLVRDDAGAIRRFHAGDVTLRAA